MQNRWTYKPERDQQRNIKTGCYTVLASGHIAGRVTTTSLQDLGVIQWRALDGQHGFISQGNVVEACKRIRDALTLTPDQQNRNWHDQRPM